MVQNHLLQLLCLIAMESPVSFEADEIRNKKVNVLQAIHPIRRETVHHYAVRGQYGKGRLHSQPVPGYRQETGVDPGTHTETFAALRLFIDNWRWQGGPFTCVPASGWLPRFPRSRYCSILSPTSRFPPPRWKTGSPIVW